MFYIKWRNCFQEFQSGSWELKQSDFPFNLVTESAVFMVVIKITPASGM